MDAACTMIYLILRVANTPALAHVVARLGVAVGGRLSVGASLRAACAWQGGTIITVSMSTTACPYD
jgi:hypothetical protein